MLMTEGTGKRRSSSTLALHLRAALAVILLLSLFSPASAAITTDLPDEARIKAEKIKYFQKKMKATGNVIVLYKGATFQADEVEYDEETKTIKAEGNVRMTQEGETLYGNNLIYQMELERATLWNARGSTSRLSVGEKKMSGRLFFWGRKIIREKEYLRIEKGIFTTCDVEKPEYHYHITCNEATIYPGDRLIARHVGVHLKKNLLMNRPLLVMSLEKKEKQNIVPQIGYSDMDGFYVKESLPLKTRKSDSGKVNIDWYQKTGFGGGIDLNSALGSSGRNIFHWYQLDPSSTGLVKPDTQNTSYNKTIGKHELSDYFTYMLPDNFYFGAGYASSQYTYPQLGSYSWTSNNMFLGKSTNRYNFNMTQASTSYNNYTYVNRSADYACWLSKKLRLRAGGLFSGYQGNTFDQRTMWNYFSDLFYDGDYLDTLLSFKSAGGASVFYLDKLPELTVLSNKLQLLDVPLNVTASTGNYKEEPTRVRMNRNSFSISTSNLSWPVGEKGLLNMGGGFRQMLFQDNSAKYVVTAGGGFYEDLGALGLRFNYFYQDPQGYSPFLSDFTSPYNMVTGGMEFHNDDQWKLSVFSGYDFQYKTFHNMIGRLSLKPAANTLIDLGSSYNIDKKYWSNMNGQINLDLGEGLSLQYWSLYDLINNKYTYQDFSISKESHDFLTRMVYRSEQKEFWVQFALKAFPYDTIPIGPTPDRIIMPMKYY
ncbi:MAG: hypothetical protein RDV48_13630 [Candidatus Eremiobacteraeota bacterium]|nr:hypothetical protein [Candidatus Eremiobacteraeota bacterium]